LRGAVISDTAPCVRMCLAGRSQRVPIIRQSAAGAAAGAARHSHVDVLYGNCRGIKQARGEIAVHAKLRNPALIILNECHVDKRDPSKLFVPRGYKVAARLDRTRNGGGLMLMCEDHLLVDTVDCSAFNTPGQAEMICVDFLGQYWVDCYTPSSQLAPVLFKACTDFRNAHPLQRMNFFGDFNSHHEEWLISSKTDAAGRCAKEFAELFSMQQLVDVATCNGNSLDLVYSDYGGSVNLNCHLGTSDHASLMVRIPTSLPLPPPSARKTVQLWKSAPWSHIKGHLRRTLAGFDSKTFASVDEADRALAEIHLSTIQKYVKTKPARAPKPVPWWNKECELAFASKQRAFEDKLNRPSKYKLSKRCCKRAQVRAYAAYQAKVRAKLSESSGNSRAFYSLAKEIGGIGPSHTAAAPCVEDLANHFADKMTIPPELDSMSYTAPDISAGYKIFKFDVSSKRVMKVLGSLDVSKSVNGVSPRFLRLCALQICPAETSLFRRIVSNAIFPSDWKCPRVTPVHKRDAVSVPKNYRPISSLPNRSLVFERVLASQLSDFCEALTPYDQFGFIRKCGTDDYGAAITLKIMDCLERRKSGILVSCDVNGAFDKVWHKCLLEKLNKGGLRRKAYRLMVSYLLARSLYVVAMGMASKKKPINSSVPQGGIWSARLWDVQVNDISQMLVWVQTLMYADDIAVWIEFSSMDELPLAIGRLNEDLDRMHQWGIQTNTSFEPSKSKFLVISGWHQDFSFIDNIVMGGIEVEQVSEMKLVGFVLDRKLSWDRMISQLASKARSKVGAIFRLRCVLDDQNLGNMYKTFIRSVMEYGAIDYQSAASTHLGKLDTVQRAAQRICGFEFESLSSRRTAASFSFLCKMLDGEARGELNAFVPEITDFDPRRTSSRVDSSGSRELHHKQGLQIKLPAARGRVFGKGPKQLECFQRGLVGSAREVFSKVPQVLLREGLEKGFQYIKPRAKRCLLWDAFSDAQKQKLGKQSQREYYASRSTPQKTNE
jgi:hypothetical protein